MHALKNQGTKYRHVAFTNSSDVSECANNAAAFAFGWANAYRPKLLLVLARQKRLSTSSSRLLGDKINGDRKIEITGARNPNVCYKDKTAPNRFHSEVSNVSRTSRTLGSSLGSSSNDDGDGRKATGLD